MKLTKKILSVVAATAMVLATLPVMPAEAANVITTYDFENGLAGLSDTGYGTAPEVTSDAEKGNVLLFHAGEASQYQSQQEDNTLEENSTNIKVGTPSSLKLDVNPFAGKSMTGATISLWVKTPTAGAEQGAGLVGFVSKKYENIVHPDRVAFGKEDVSEEIGGYYTYGIGTASHDYAFMTGSMLYFGGFLRNTMWYLDADQTFMTNADKWTHMIVTLGNNSEENAVYINGVKLSGGDLGIGKRFNHGELDGNPGNTDQPLMFEVLTAADTNAYLGYTGGMASVEGVMIDDVTYYDAIVSDAEALSLYETAKANMSGDGGSASTGGNQNTGADTTTNAGNGNNNTTTNNNNTSGNKTSTNKTNNTTTQQNLPQTGVASTGLLIAGGAAAIAAGAILFKKKENDEQ